MCRMLLSINPEYVERILNGEKLFEYRKRKCRDDVDKIIIYETSPIKKVVAEAEIEIIIEDDVKKVWNKTKNYSGTTYDFFQKYYKDKKKAVAYKLKNVIRYEKPLELRELGIDYVPQSFCYLP